VTQAFVDESLPSQIQGMPCHAQPRFSTRIVMAKSGAEARNRNWMNPLRKFSLPEAVTDMDSFEAVESFWEAMGGPFSTWPFRNPFDFASCALAEPNVAPTVTGADQVIATGNGVDYQFQLIKTRAVGPVSLARPIVLPILDTVIIEIGGFPPAEVPPGFPFMGPYTVESITRPGGIVTISPPLAPGIVMTAGYLYDTLVRFEGDDTFDAIVHSLETVGSSALNLVEVRYC